MNFKNYIMEANGIDREYAEAVDYLMQSKGMSYEEALETSLMLLQIQSKHFLTNPQS